MTSLKNSLWVNKYQPKTIGDVIFQNKKQQDFFKNIVKTGDLPNLLLQGMRGTGKSTISLALMKDLKVDPSDILVLKCSSEGIDALRKKAEIFSMTFPLGKMKVIRLEEFDYLSLEAQALLRSLIEDSSSTCRWIATCNYVNKIMPEVRSRFQEFSFKAPDNEGVVSKMVDILEAEKIEYLPDDLFTFVSVGYPDIRKTIQLLQQNSINGKLNSPKDESAIDSDWKFGLLAQLNSGDFKKARKLTCDNANREEYEDIYRFLYENVEKFKVKDSDTALIWIAEHNHRHQFSSNVELNLAACFIRIGQS